MPSVRPQLRLVLASASPRRRELLAALGVPFEVHSADLDEAPREGERPEEYVARLAREKAAAVAARFPGALVLGADTSVILGEEILGKPADEEEGRAMLRRLSGRTHRVLSAVALEGAHRALTVVETVVHFRALTEAQIAWYVSTGEPLDKAGAYAVQGRGGAFVRAVEGSPSNVVGLPLAETLDLLEEASFPLAWTTA